MNWKKTLTAGVAVASAAMALTACGSSDGSKSNGNGKLADKQVLNWNEASELATMDPVQGHGYDRRRHAEQHDGRSLSFGQGFEG